MSPRRNRRTSDVPRQIAGSPQWTEEDNDDEWIVRAVTGVAKTYRCPGCDQEIRPGTGHVVAWPVGDAAERRHWHRPCWQHRQDRKPRYRRP